VVTRHTVAFTPGWERECSELNTLHLKGCGTNGRDTLVEVSQRMLVVEAGSVTFSSFREGEDFTVTRSGSPA